MKLINLRALFWGVNARTGETDLRSAAIAIRCGIPPDLVPAGKLMAVRHVSCIFSPEIGVGVLRSLYQASEPTTIIQVFLVDLDSRAASGISS